MAEFASEEQRLDYIQALKTERSMLDRFPDRVALIDAELDRVGDRPKARKRVDTARKAVKASTRQTRSAVSGETE